MKKKKTDEGVFDAAKRFSDAFFDGLKKGATDNVLKKAKEKNVPNPVIEKMEELEREKEELDALLKKYS